MNKTKFPAQRLYDAHAHIGSEAELRERKRDQITSLVCASTPPEAAKLEELLQKKGYSCVILPTYGLHPWHTDKYNVRDMDFFLEKCSVIGEIGMDSVWCSTPPEIQEAAFRYQLSIASSMKKPVIVHTKGQEKQISSILNEYQNTYLIHWYSSMDYLDSYLSMDCYYTIGPDLLWNKAVRQVASRVPLDRILVETDGMSAVQWAYDEAPRAKFSSPAPPRPATLSEALATALVYTAKIRGISKEAMTAQVEKNFLRFINIALRMPPPAPR